MRLHQRIGERMTCDRLDSRRRLERAQLVPHRERRIHRRVGIELANRIEINRRRGRQHIFDDRVDVGIEPPRTRDRFGGALRIDAHGLANFRERSRNFILPQQEISVAPRHFRGNRINALRLLKRIARGGCVRLRIRKPPRDRATLSRNADRAKAHCDTRRQRAARQALRCCIANSVRAETTSRDCPARAAPHALVPARVSIPA